MGRGWPVPVPLNAFDGFPEDYFVGAVTPWYYTTSATATGGKAPAGVQPLPRDIFTSKDFYADKDLWMDKRYYRCNSPISLDSIWGDYSSGPRALENGNPATAAWGHCDRDYPREAIVSPYPFKTAQAHYEALLAETRARGGPAAHTTATLPDWNGRYTRNLNLVFGRGRRGGAGDPLPQEFAEPPQWVVGWANQMPTILSLLTPRSGAACEAGCRYYHMGESGGAGSLIHFKARYGAIEYSSSEYLIERIPVVRDAALGYSSVTKHPFTSGHAARACLTTVGLG